MNDKASSKKVENRDNLRISKTSNLYRLDPILTEDGILRGGGRVRGADVPLDAKHPCKLPRRGHITQLINSHFHQKVAHQGRGMTHTSIRSSGFWIISGSSVLSNHISKCVKCIKLRSSLQKLRMADLLGDCLERSPSFTYSVVDYFGPWMVKEGRRSIKRYGVLFTCLVLRAIDLET